MMVSHPVALVTGCLVFSYDRSGWLTGSMGQREQRRTTFVWEGFRLLQETTWQGKRTYLYDAEQPYTPVAAITGRGESRKIWYYHTDVTGTVQEVSAADGTLVWAGYQAGFGENRGDISNSGRTLNSRCDCRGSTLTKKRGCITICSDIMRRSVGGLSARIR